MAVGTELKAIIVIALFVISILAVVFVSRFMINRAIRSVILLFRQYDAVTVRSARTIDELGLKPKSMAGMLLRPRDYKLTTLQILMNASIIQMTEDGRLYLAEDQLETSRWKLC